MCSVKKVDLCVVGAGISGLSLAAFASERLTVCVLEKKSTVGGLLQSHQLGEALFDEAANGWLDSEPAVEALIQLVNATSLVTPANTNKATRYLVHRGLHALSPKLLLRSTPLLSWWHKIRIARELIWSSKPKGEPSMAEFMSNDLEALSSIIFWHRCVLVFMQMHQRKCLFELLFPIFGIWQHKGLS